MKSAVATTVTQLLLGAAAILALAGAVGAAQAQPDSAQIVRILALQDQLYRDRFVAAESLAADFTTAYPDHALGYLFKAITLVSAMYDAEESSRADHFHALLDSAQALAIDAVKTASGTERAWAFLVLGHVESYRAVWEVRFGSRLSAARKGRAGAAHYRRGLAADSTLGDLYFGLGLYHYWKSAKAGVLRWIGLVADDKERGYAQLQRAAAHSTISQQAAGSALIWVHFDRNEWDSAIILCNELLERYPENHSFLWPLAKAHAGAERFAEAAAIYARLRSHYADNPGNYHNLIECDYHLARCYDRLDRPEALARATDQAAGYLDHLSTDIRDRQSERIRYLSEAED